MDNSKILERWKDLDAQRAQKNRDKSGSTASTGNSGVSTPNSTPTTSFSESIRVSSKPFLESDSDEVVIISPLRHLSFFATQTNSS